MRGCWASSCRRRLSRARNRDFGVTPLLIVTGLVGLAIGVWLGMPGRYTQTLEDIEERMESGGVRRRLKKRSVNPLAWMHRKASVKDTPSRGRRQGRGRSAFRLETPEDRDSA